MRMLLRYPSLKKNRTRKKSVIMWLVEAKEVRSVPLLIEMLFSALVKEGVNGESLADAG